MVLKRVLVGVGALVLTLSGCGVFPEDKPRQAPEVTHVPIKKRYEIDGRDFLTGCLGKDLMVLYLHDSKFTVLANHEECK